MGKRVPLVVTATLITAVIPARADPVTPADLAGKTICWEGASFGPNKSFFGQSGEYSSGVSGKATGFGKGTWAVTSAGVQIGVKSRRFVDDMEKQPDGTFVSMRFGKSTGKVCD
jgi:hypothetical protein